MGIPGLRGRKVVPQRTAGELDAMAAAGAEDGEYDLGPMKVRVVDGLARTIATGSIAGSTLVLLDAVRNVASWGIPLEDAIHSATALPAAYMGLEGVGALEAGMWADVLLLDEDLAVAGVIRRGEQIA